MSRIAADFFASSPLMAAPQIAMLLFFAIFVAVCVRVARTRARDWDTVARLALDDEEERR
jgi:hypothetical protein